MLAGIRVVDATRHFPGPYCTLLLADLGAEVIKLEPPGFGDPLRIAPPYYQGESALFGAFNRGKRSLCCDLKQASAQELVRRLVATADVFVEGFRPGVAERLGLGPDRLRAADPQLIYCSLTGYGQDGPLASMAGHDLNFQALSGVVDRSGPADGPPALPGQPLGDLAAGGLLAATTILAALIARTREGGRYLDVAMLDGLLSFQAMARCEVLAGEPCSRQQTMLTGLLPCYNIYQTADGRHVAFAPLEEKFWRAFIEATGRADLEGLQYEDDPEAIARLAALFAERDRDAWEALGREVDCCLTPVLDSAEALEHPQVVARRAVLAQAPHGIRFPVRSSPDGCVAPSPPPELGRDAAALMTELGYDAAAQSALRASGAVPEAAGG